MNSMVHLYRTISSSTISTRATTEVHRFFIEDSSIWELKTQPENLLRRKLNLLYRE